MPHLHLCQVHGILEGASAVVAAADYAQQIASLPADVLPRAAATGLPAFDLLLLGVGPDGHVASLFPGHAALLSQEQQQQQQRAAARAGLLVDPDTYRVGPAAGSARVGSPPPGHHHAAASSTTATSASTGAWVLPVLDSPKPPPQRITMSLPVLNAAAQVVFVALGEGKSEIVAHCLEPPPGSPQLPAQMVRCLLSLESWGHARVRVRACPPASHTTTTTPGPVVTCALCRCCLQRAPSGFSTWAARSA
jgi:6-phosphogluconolactonase